MKYIASSLLLLALMPVQAVAQAPGGSIEDPAQASEKKGLCVVGRAAPQRNALVGPAKPQVDETELDAIAEALLNCSPEEMKANRAREMRAPIAVTQAFARDLIHRSIPAGNG